MKIQLTPNQCLHKNKEGYTIFSTAYFIPIISMDAPYKRLSEDKGFASGLVHLLNEFLPGHEEQEKIQEVIEELKHYAT